MNEFESHSDHGGQSNNDGDDIDTGAPIAEFAALAAESTPSFAAGVQRRIERRLFAANVLQQAIHAPFVVLREYSMMVFSVMRSRPREGGREKWNKDST